MTEAVSHLPLKAEDRTGPQDTPRNVFYYYYYYLFTTCNWVGTRWQESFKHIT